MKNNLSSLQEAYAKQRAELEKLESKLQAEQTKQFTALPGQLGLGSIDALIKALAPYASPKMKAALKVGGGIDVAKVRVTAKAPDAATGDKPEKTRKRAKITDEIRAKVIEAIKAGGKTAAQLATEFGISVPSVNNIKAAAKLTKPKE